MRQGSRPWLCGTAALALYLAGGAPVVDATALVPPLSTVHYLRDGRLVHVPVAIDGVRLWFDVDTGARHTVIDAATAKRLRLHIVRGDRMTGAGHGSVSMQHGAPLEVTIGAVRPRVADPWILDLGHVGTSRRVDGLLGADLFAEYVVRIDPVSQTVAFCDPGTFRYSGSGAAVPLRVRDNRLFVTMTLSVGNGISATRFVRIDTGSGDAVSADLVRQSPTRRRSLQGVGLGKAYVDYSGVFASIQVGPYRMYDVWGPSNTVPTVGMEILRRFILTFDAPHRRLYLQPTAHLNDPVPAPAP
jgi:hypothetical protein